MNDNRTIHDIDKEITEQDSFERKLQRHVNILQNNIFKEFNFKQFPKDQQREFNTKISHYNISYLKQAVRIKGSPAKPTIISYDKKTSIQTFCKPIFNSYDNAAIHKILYGETYPTEWYEISTSFHRLKNTFLSKNINHLFTSSNDKDLYYRTWQEITCYQNLIMSSNISTTLKIELLEMYIILISETIKSLILKLVTHNINIDFENLIKELHYIYNDMPREYNDIDSAFKFYLVRIHILRHNNQYIFTRRYALECINHLNRHYTDTKCNSLEEIFEDIQKQLNITLEQSEKEKLVNYITFIRDENLVEIPNDSSMSWAIIYDCIFNQPTKHNFPSMQKRTDIYSISDTNCMNSKYKSNYKSKWDSPNKGKTIKFFLDKLIKETQKNPNKVIDIDENLDYISHYITECRAKCNPNLSDLKMDIVCNVYLAVNEILSSFVLSYSFEYFFAFCKLFYRSFFLGLQKSILK